MSMAARKDDRPTAGDHQESVRDKLEQVLRDALRPKLGPKSMLLEELVEAVVDAMKGNMILGIKRPRQLKTSRLALARRLPEMGVNFSHEHKGKVYQVKIVEGDMVEMESDGQVERYKSLKQAMVAILGYDSPVTGWRFFFGPMSHDEVTKRYKVEP